MLNQRMSQERFLQLRTYLDYPTDNPFFAGDVEDIRDACKDLILFPVNSGEDIAEFHRIQAIDWFNQLRFVGSEQQADHAVAAIGMESIVHIIKSNYEDLTDEDKQSGEYFNIERAYNRYNLAESETTVYEPRQVIGAFATLLDIYDEPAQYHYLTAMSVEQ